MAASSNESVEKKFQNVTNRQDSIQSLSLWIIHHKNHYKKIVDTWYKVLKKAKTSHRLTLFYLCNDVVQNCKRKGALVYQDAFKNILKDAVLLVRDHSIKTQVERLITIWEDRNVYDAEFLSELQALLVNSKVRASMNSKLLAEFKPQSLISTISSFRRYEDETMFKQKQLTNLRLDAASVEAVQQLKDRAHGKEFSQQFEDSCVKYEEYVTCLEKEIKDRTALIDCLEKSEIFYDAQYGEVKIVANAYKNFSTRVNNVKKKLADKKLLLPDSLSPIPSPSMDAPSPGNTPPPDPSKDNTEEVDMELSDEEQDAGKIVAAEPLKLSTSSKSSPMPIPNFLELRKKVQRQKEQRLKSESVTAPMPQPAPVKPSAGGALDDRLAGMGGEKFIPSLSSSHSEAGITVNGSQRSNSSTKGEDGGGTPLKDEGSSTPVQDEDAESKSTKGLTNPIEFLTKLINQSQKSGKATAANFMQNLSLLTQNIQAKVEPSSGGCPEEEEKDSLIVPSSWPWETSKPQQVPPPSSVPGLAVSATGSIIQQNLSVSPPLAQMNFPRPGPQDVVNANPSPLPIGGPIPSLGHNNPPPTSFPSHMPPSSAPRPVQPLAQQPFGSPPPNFQQPPPRQTSPSQGGFLGPPPFQPRQPPPQLQQPLSVPPSGPLPMFQNQQTSPVIPGFDFTHPPPPFQPTSPQVSGPPRFPPLPQQQQQQQPQQLFGGPPPTGPPGAPLQQPQGLPMQQPQAPPMQQPQAPPMQQPPQAPPMQQAQVPPMQKPIAPPLNPSMVNISRNSSLVVISPTESAPVSSHDLMTQSQDFNWHGSEATYVNSKMQTSPSWLTSTSAPNQGVLPPQGVPPIQAPNQLTGMHPRIDPISEEQNEFIEKLKRKTTPTPLASVAENPLAKAIKELLKAPTDKSEQNHTDSSKEIKKRNSVDSDHSSKGSDENDKDRSSKRRKSISENEHKSRSRSKSPKGDPIQTLSKGPQSVVKRVDSSDSNRDRDSPPRRIESTARRVSDHDKDRERDRDRRLPSRDPYYDRRDPYYDRRLPPPPDPYYRELYYERMRHHFYPPSAMRDPYRDRRGYYPPRH